MGGREAGMHRDITASYLDLYSLGDVKDEVNIGVVVIVGSSRNWNEVVCQLDVLCICLGEEGRRRGGEEGKSSNSHNCNNYNNFHHKPAVKTLTFRSSGVTMAWNCTALSFPNISYAHLLTDRMNLTAPIPLLATRIFSITRLPP